MTEERPGASSVNEERILRESVSAFCSSSGYVLSSQADSIFKDIFQMKALTGEFYCPCQTQRVPETICVCQPVRNGLVDIMGACFCGLIVSKS